MIEIHFWPYGSVPNRPHMQRRAHFNLSDSGSGSALEDSLRTASRAGLLLAHSCRVNHSTRNSSVCLRATRPHETCGPRSASCKMKLPVPVGDVLWFRKSNKALSGQHHTLKYDGADNFGRILLCAQLGQCIKSSLLRGG